jgi:hypothetical protein
MLDGQTIRAVLTLKSSNAKTGDMAQLWILRDDMAPHTAQRVGADASICGDCPFRPSNGGGCYVVTFQGPLSVYRSTCGAPVRMWAAVAHLTARDGDKARLRLGAYGDPAALPAAVVETLVRAVKGRTTGYTHQWRNDGSAWLRSLVMASVETARDALIAQSRGWRTFRVTPNDATLQPGEITCLAESRDLQCAACGLCKGASLQAKSIAIPAHGYAVSKASRVTA